MKEMCLDFYKNNKDTLISQGFLTFEEYFKFIEKMHKKKEAN